MTNISAMSRKLLLKKTYEKMDELSEWRLREVHDFVIFLSSMKEEEELTKDLTYLNENSESFDFLNEEEDYIQIQILLRKEKRRYCFFLATFSGSPRP